MVAGNELFKKQEISTTQRTTTADKMNEVLEEADGIINRREELRLSSDEFLTDMLSQANPPAAKLDRRGDWVKYSKRVEDHIESYTRKQYESEDGTTDQVQSWTAQQCIDAIRRYCDRFGSNARGFEDQLRDMLKISHYAQLAHDKLKEVSLKDNADHRGLMRLHDVKKMLHGLISARALSKPYIIKNGSPFYYEITEGVVDNIKTVLAIISDGGQIKE